MAKKPSQPDSEQSFADLSGVLSEDAKLRAVEKIDKAKAKKAAQAKASAKADLKSEDDAEMHSPTSSGVLSQEQTVTYVTGDVSSEIISEGFNERLKELHGVVSLPEQGTQDLVDKVAQQALQNGFKKWQRSTCTKLGPRFHVEHMLGRGGQGLVFRLHDRDTGRDVAVKVLNEKYATPLHLSRFVHEVQVTAQLKHPGIIAIYDFNTLPGGIVFYTMEAIEQGTLENQFEQATDRVEKRDDWLRVMEQVCDTLAYAHSQGVVHRDLKPHNIAVGNYGDVRVLDWGIAKVLPGSRFFTVRVKEVVPEIDKVDPSSAEFERVTAIGRVLGTPHYMSPEQARGDIRDIGPTSDVFSLGVILYRMLSGRLPHGDTEEKKAIVKRLSEGKIDKLVDLRIPPALRSIVDRALAVNPADRYQNAGELGQELKRFLRGQAVVVHQESVFERMQRFAKRHRPALRSGLFVGGMAIFIALCALASQQMRQQNQINEWLKQGYVAERQQRYEEAHEYFAKILGYNPDHEDAERGQVRVQEELRNVTSKELRGQAIVDLANARTLIDELQSMDDLHRAKELATVVLNRLPADSEDLRNRALDLRSEIDVLLVADAQRVDRQRAQAELQRSQEFLTAGKHSKARESLGRARSLVPDNPQIQAVEDQLNQAEEARQQARRARQAQELLTQAEGLVKAGSLEMAVSTAGAAFSLFPDDSIEQQFEAIMANVVDAREALRAEQRKDAIHAQVEEVRSALKAGAWQEAQKLLLQLRKVDPHNEHVSSLEDEVAQLRYDYDRKHADITLDHISDLMKPWRISHEVELALRQELKEMLGLIRGRLPNAEERQRERELRRELRQLESEEVNNAEQLTNLLQQSRQILPTYARWNQLAADYYRERVILSRARGDYSAAEVYALLGQEVDKSGRYQLLFSKQARLRSSQELTYRLLDRASNLIDRNSQSGGEAGLSGQLTPDLEQSVPAGTYEFSAPGCVQVTVKLLSGERYEILLPEKIDLPSNLVAVVEVEQGQVAMPFAAMKHEVTNADWLAFLNHPDIEQKRRSKREVLPPLAPRTHYSTKESLWKLVRGRYVLEHASSGVEFAPQAPIAFVSAQAIDVFISWRREQDGIAWRLPTMKEWRLLASGGPGQPYVHGQSMDFDRSTTGATIGPTQGYLNVAVGSQIDDRSIHGVKDCAGSVAELLADSPAGSPQLRLYSGGNWGDRDSYRFRLDGVRIIDQRQVSPFVGFRLVADIIDGKLARTP